MLREDPRSYEKRESDGKYEIDVMDDGWMMDATRRSEKLRKEGV